MDEPLYYHTSTISQRVLAHTQCASGSGCLKRFLHFERVATSHHTTRAKTSVSMVLFDSSSREITPPTKTLLCSQRETVRVVVHTSHTDLAYLSRQDQTIS